MQSIVTDSGEQVLTVSELNRSARDLLEHGLPLMWVAGEISNFIQAVSGHCYFSLKDESAQVRCVMFRHRFQYLDWKPENGAKVEVRALVTLYEAKGEFQLSIETMRAAGMGALYEAFQKLKAKLEKQGLFAAETKKPLPSFPKCIGVITSPKAAALRDVLTTLERRMPSIPVILYPTPVQGEGSGEKVAASIKIASQRAECDVLILCRGGGSIEDLWAFNEEVVARAIHASKIPIVSGVGHETDFTIADFVADARAPTPTAAAEIVSPDREELTVRLSAMHAQLLRELTRMLEQRMQKTDYLTKRLAHPGERIRNQIQHLGHLGTRAQSAWTYQHETSLWSLNRVQQDLLRLKPDIQILLQTQGQLAKTLVFAATRYFDRVAASVLGLQKHLESLNPQAVLERGYSITRKPDGSIVRSASQVGVGQALDLTFAEGGASVIVKDEK